VRRPHSFSNYVGEPSRAGGVISRTATNGCESCSRTGAKSTGRLGGVHRTGRWRVTRKSSPHGKVMGLTVVTGGPVALPSIGGAEGTGGSYPRARVREAGPPFRRYLYVIQTLPT
jgi:hypothetical protein